MARTPKKNPDAALAQAWKDFYATPQGQAAIGALFAEFHVYDPIVSYDPVQLAMMNGQRNVALRIAQLLALRPERFAETATEDMNALASLYP